MVAHPPSLGWRWRSGRRGMAHPELEQVTRHARRGIVERRRVHSPAAVCALSLATAAGCAELLDIPSRPRLVETLPDSPDASSAVASPDAREPSPASTGGTGGIDHTLLPADAGDSRPPDEADAAPPGAPDAASPESSGDGDAGDSGALEPEPCGPGEAQGPNDNCFIVLTDLTSWSDARLACQARGTGWDLAALRDTELNDFLGTLAFDETWIGASDAIDEATWIWVRDGAAFWIGDGETGSVVEGAFANWNSDEPNGEDTSDCARFVPPQNTWADLECASLRAAACEGPAVSP